MADDQIEREKQSSLFKNRGKSPSLNRGDWYLGGSYDIRGEVNGQSTKCTKEHGTKNCTGESPVLSKCSQTWFDRKALCSKG